MSLDSDDRDEMKGEYDIRGGMRGKYAKRYWQASTSISVSFEESPVIAKTEVSTPWVGSITQNAVYPPSYPCSKIQVGIPQ
jgi:hypothetical protein